MSRTRREIGWKVLLGAVLLAATITRLAGIGSLHFPDEAWQLYRSLKIGAGEFYPNWFVGVYSYLMFVWYSGLFALGLLAGWWSSMSDFMGVYYTHPHVFYLAGRIAESLAGVGGVYCLYLLGKRLWNRTIGLAAALFLALNITHIQVSQIARGQAIALLFGLLSLLLVERFISKHRFPHLIWAGMFFAAAVSIRIYYLAYAIPIGAFLLWDKRRGISWKAGAILAASTVFFSLLFTPDIIVAPRILLEGLSMAAVPLTSDAQLSFEASEGAIRNPLRTYLLNLIPDSVGWPLYLIAAAGLLAALPRIKKPSFAAIGIMPIPFILIMGASRLTAIRYVLPAFPMLFLLAGFVLEAIVSVLPSFFRRGSVVMAAALLLVSPRIGAIARWDIDQNRLQTIDLAKDWIIANVPDRAGVAVESTGYAGPNIRLYSVIDYDIYRMSPEELRSLYAKRMQTDPSGSRALKYFIEHPPKPWHRVYDLNIRHPVPLATLIEEGVQYFVLSSGVAESYIQDRTRERLPDLVANREAFYDWVAAQCALIKVFSPSAEHPGPEILIYRLKAED